MKKELTHVGPFIERMILDSWSINGYLVGLCYGFLGGGVIRIFRGNESIYFWPTDASIKVILLFLNNAIWACENECINFLPEKPFTPRSSEAEKSLLFYKCEKWPAYKDQLKIQDFVYVDNIDAEAIEKIIPDVVKVARKDLYEQLDKISPNLNKKPK